MAKAPVRRPAKEIIDNAVADNRWWEQLCFGLVVLLVAAGLATLVAGIIREVIAVTVTGGAVTATFVPALRFARTLRERNMRIRMSEVPLSLAKTADEANNIVCNTFGDPKGKES